MAQKQGFELPGILCSNEVTVGWGFYNHQTKEGKIKVLKYLGRNMS